MEEFLCGICEHSWDCFELVCSKHNNAPCPYPCEECPDFEVVKDEE